MCKTRKSLVIGELSTRILIGVFNLYTIISNGTIMLTQNELQKYLIISNLVSGSSGLILTYINESLKNQISNYDTEDTGNRRRRSIRTRSANGENPSKKLNSWIPFTYSM
jgi:NAD/NADP transhydrogenase beta subunit